MNRIRLGCAGLAALGLLWGCGRVKPTPVEEIGMQESAVAAIEQAEPIVTQPGDWPWWRGPARDGVSAETDLPIQWTSSKNVLWKSPVPGRGHSSPSVWGDRVFLTTADEQSRQQIVLCYDRNSGRELWRRVAFSSGLMRKHSKNSYASGTPACDGRRVYAAMINDGALRVVAVDWDGKISWRRAAGDFTSEHGYGSAPVLYRSLVIVLGDNLSGSFLAALDRETGNVVWRTARPTTGRHGSYATPVVAKVAGIDQLLVTGMGVTSSYDPATGALIWECAGPAEVTANTVAFSDELVFASGGFPENEILAIRGSGTGDVTGTHVAWRAQQGMTYVPSPVYHDGRLYIVNDDGIVSCYKADDGEQLWQNRLSGAFSASPVLAGGHFYATNEDGVTFVFKTEPEFEIVAANDLGGGGMASPVICGRQIFLRTGRGLYCIGKKAVQTARVQ